MERKTKDKAGDADFLAKTFDMAPQRAAELVTQESGDTARVADEAVAIDKARDPLAEVPVPEEPASEQAKDNDEVRLKPIVRENNRRGAG